MGNVFISVILLYFNQKSRLISGVLDKIKSGCFENQMGEEFDSYHTTVKLVSKSIS